MKKNLIPALVVSLALVGCGGGSSDQDEVADIVIKAAEDAGAEPDSDCIREQADKLSDDDAGALVDAGLEGDPDVSAEANEILAEMLTC